MGKVPPYSVVVSGSLPAGNGPSLYCAVIVKRVDEKTRAKTSINELLQNLMLDAVALAQALIRCPSVTPADAGALGVLEAALKPLGFACHRLRFGRKAPRRSKISMPGLARARHISASPVTPMWCRRAKAGRMIPSRPTISDGMLYRARRRRHEIGGGGVCGGRGAGDRRTDPSTAPSACSSPATRRAPAINGTAKMLDWLKAARRAHRSLRGGRAHQRGTRRRHAEDRAARLDQFSGDGEG